MPSKGIPDACEVSASQWVKNFNSAGGLEKFIIRDFENENAFAEKIS